MIFQIPSDAVGLRLARITRGGELILCEAMKFEEGYSAVETILRRAAISGRVEVDGEILNGQRGDFGRTCPSPVKRLDRLGRVW